MATLTDREREIIVQAWACMVEQPSVDYNKLADVAKLSTKASANTAYCNVKKKLLASPLKPLTQRDTTVLVLSMQCLKSAEKVDYKALAEKANLKSAASANTAYYNAKKKLLNGQIEATTPDDDAPPAPAPSSKKRKSISQGETPTPAPSAKKQKRVDEETTPTPARSSKKDKREDMVADEVDNKTPAKKRRSVAVVVDDPKRSSPWKRVRKHRVSTPDFEKVVEDHYGDTSEDISPKTRNYLFHRESSLAETNKFDTAQEYLRDLKAGKVKTAKVGAESEAMQVDDEAGEDAEVPIGEVNAATTDPMEVDDGAAEEVEAEGDEVGQGAEGDVAGGIEAEDHVKEAGTIKAEEEE